MSIFLQGEFTLSSGQESQWKVDCDGLTDEDWNTLAAMAMEMWDLEFGEVIGIPTGGIKFADAMSKYSVGYSDILLVVDDVYTTGNTIETEMNKHKRVAGLVAFTRGPHPMRVFSIWNLGA